LGDKNYVASLNQQIFGCGPEFPRLWDYPAIPPLTSNFSDKVFDELIHRCLSTKIRNPWKDLSKQISSLCEEAAPSHRKITARRNVPSRREYLLSKLCEVTLLRQVNKAAKAWLSDLNLG
jgi:hypothetical protein